MKYLDKAPLSTEHFTISIKEGIIHTEFPKGTVVTLAVAKQVVEDRIKYTEGESYNAIVDISGIQKVELDARKYWASEEAYACLNRLAVYSNNTLSKIFANFWLKIDKPFKPTKFFTNKGSALLYANVINLN